MRSVLFVVLEDRRLSDLCKLEYSWSQYWHIISIQVHFVVWNIYWLMIWTGIFGTVRNIYIHFKTNICRCCNIVPVACDVCHWMYVLTSCLLSDISALLCNILVETILCEAHTFTLYTVVHAFISECAWKALIWYNLELLSNIKFVSSTEEAFCFYLYLAIKIL